MNDLFLPSTACGRGKAAEGGEGEGLKGGPCSGPHPDSLRESVPLPQAVEGLERVRLFSFHTTPICHSRKANSSAVSFSESKRPDLPPWPAPILVLSSSTASSVFVARSFAVHFAGSQ